MPPPHDIQFDGPADDTYVSLGRPFQEEIAIHLARLSEDPEKLSRPSHFPYPPGFELYQFDMVHDGQTYMISFLFNYGDEDAVIIRRIGLVRYKNRPTDYP